YNANQPVVSLNGLLSSGGENASDTTETDLNHFSDIIISDPLLAPLGAYGGFTLTQIPLAGSPIIDQGSNPPPTNAPATDQRGLPRISNGDGFGSTVIDIGAAEAQPFVTVTTAVDESNGTGAGAGASLRERLAIATPGQMIRFDPSLSGSEITLNAGLSQFDTLGAGEIIHIDASNLAEPVTINATAVDGIFHLQDGAVLSAHHLNLKDSPDDGVLDCFTASDATLDRCVVSGCTNHQAISQVEGRIVLDHCVVSDNNGGGNAALTLGGGGWGRVSFTAFERNVGTSTGGGVSVVDSIFTAINSSFLENKASSGAGLSYSPGSERHAEALKLWGCTFSGNSSNGIGGGINFLGSYAEIAYCTIVSNLAASRGAGIAVISSTDQEIVFHRNIIAKNRKKGSGSIDNIDTTTPVEFNSEGYNLTDTSEDVFDHFHDITETDPRLGPLTFHRGSHLRVHYPLSGSPVIDASFTGAPIFLNRDNTGALRRQNGNLSIPGAAADIGAAEATAPIIVNTLLDELDVPAGTNISLREAIRDAPDHGRILFVDGLTDTFASEFIDLRTSALGQNTSISVEKSIIIDASNQPTGITLIGPTSDHVFNMPSSGHDVSVHGISFTGGNPPATGGGIRNIGCRLTLTHSAIYGNNAGTDGAGILLNNAIALLENVTISGNDASDQGGAVYSFSNSELTLRHCTVANNESTNSGAGFFTAANSTVNLYSSIVANNRRQNLTLANSAGGGTINSLGYNLSDGTFISGPTDLAPIAQPGLVGLSNAGGFARTHPLDFNSPAANAGPPDFSVSDPCTDARGFPRIVCGRIDIGAYELGGALDGLPGLDLDNDGMDDFWEVFFGLNSSIDDSRLDLDGDGASN
ncbi:MAG: right-handed parallel beta-helix repeat-containing protein, partial [Verrucomicrobiota bacterium]